MPRSRFGLFEFDSRSGELRRDGEVVKLPPQPARVLALLLARPGELILREEFQRAIWGDDTFVDFERGLNFCVVQVRTALGDAADNPRFVQTVPRKGYRFIAPVVAEADRRDGGRASTGTEVGDGGRASAGTEVGDGGRGLVGTEVERTPARPVGTEVALGNSSRGNRQGRRSVWLTVVAAALILAPVAWLVWGNRPSSTPAAVAAATPYRIRIAVLPFVNLTGDATADYIADGLTDELISQLGTLSRRRLAVIARTSAMTYRSSSKTITRIGEELDVQYVVESSIRREGTGLRVGSNLVSVIDQTPFAGWTESFQNTAASPEARQMAAAIRFARLIALALLPESDTAQTPRRPSNPDAWDQFLQGLASMNRGTPDDVRRAIGQFEGAAQKDTGFAAAWAKIAEAHHLLVMMGTSAPADAYPAARDAADRALAADAALPDAHLARGLVHLWYEWQPAAAAASFERALALNDSLASAHHDYAWSLMAMGRTDDAIRHISEARDLDPLSTRANNDVGWLHLYLRQPEDATRACEHTLAIQPASLEAQGCLERSYAHRGMFDAALEAARATLPRPADVVIPAGTKAADALQMIWQWRLQQLERAAKTRWISPYALAVQYLLAGNSGKALDELERAHRERVGMMVFLERDPALDPVRREPRFQALLAQVSETAR